MANDDAQSGAELVRALAALGRVGLTDEEAEGFGGQLDAILESVSALQEVDTTDVEPTGHAIDLINVYRDDAGAESFTRGEMLANAPASQEGYVRVRYVFGDEGDEAATP